MLGVDRRTIGAGEHSAASRGHRARVHAPRGAVQARRYRGVDRGRLSQPPNNHPGGEQRSYPAAPVREAKRAGECVQHFRRHPGPRSSIGQSSTRRVEVVGSTPTGAVASVGSSSWEYVDYGATSEANKTGGAIFSWNGQKVTVALLAEAKRIRPSSISGSGACRRAARRRHPVLRRRRHRLVRADAGNADRQERRNNPAA